MIPCQCNSDTQTNQPRVPTPNHLLHKTLTHQANILSALNHPRARYWQLGTTSIAQSLQKLFKLSILSLFSLLILPCPSLSTKSPVKLWAILSPLCLLTDPAAAQWAAKWGLQGCKCPYPGATAQSCAEDALPVVYRGVRKHWLPSTGDWLISGGTATHTALEHAAYIHGPASCPPHILEFRKARSWNSTHT